MIQLLKQGLKGVSDFGEVLDPALPLCHRTFNVDFDVKRMAVQPPALMALGNIRQLVCGFYRKALEYFHGKANRNRALVYHFTDWICRAFRHGSARISVPGIRALQ